MAISVLHISDLHRDPSHEVTSQALLDSLERDRDRYRAEIPAIPDPNIIIVSGDVVHGVKANATDPDGELKRQYDQAEAFLIALTDSFVGGNRERVVIIPGNHDVSFPHALRGMKLIEVNLSTEEQRAAAVANGRRLLSPSTPMRWSWAGFCFYEIIDKGLYDARLEAFCTFYGQFYQGKRSYSLNPEEQFDVFDYPEHNITIAGLSSCHENDPFNKQGAIHPECVAAAARRLCEPKYRDRFLFAVWHHNTSGGPTKSDYMDADILQVLIDDGFSLGFHGHQHKPQFIEERFQFGGTRKITVISASTLCAGPRELPTGQSRGYNLLEFDAATRKAKLHQRKMENENFGRPIWGPGQFPSSRHSFVEFDVQAPIERKHSVEDANAIGSAEAFLRTGKPKEAIELLRPLMGGNSLAKKLLWECYVALGDNLAIIADFYPPQAVAEIVHVADALWEEGNRLQLKELLKLDAVCNSSDPAVVKVRELYNARLSP